MEKRRIAGLLVLAGLALAALFFFPRDAASPIEQAVVEIGGREVAVEVAWTPELREKGLSGRESLATGSGMLFLYPLPGLYGFWMPDMNFSIDIIWIDLRSETAGSVAFIEEDVSPESYPKVFHPDTAARAVLEVPAGFVRETNLKVGDPVSFKKLSVEPR